MRAPSMVFENHTAGEVAEGPAVREHIGAIFAAWPDIHFESRRTYVREDLVGKTILSAQEVEDVVAYLGTLKE